MKKKLFRTIFSILISIFFLLTIFLNLVFTDEFYLYESARNEIPREIGIKSEDILGAYNALTDYIQGDIAVPQIKLEVNGNITEVFNKKEIDHMKDVKDLFYIINLGYKILIITIFLLFTYGYFKKFNLIKIAIGQFYVTLVIFIGLMIITLGDFTNNFIVFHEFLFSNDLWLLDPMTDRMIVMLPEVVFKDIAIFSFSGYFLISFLFMFIIKLISKLKK